MAIPARLASFVLGLVGLFLCATATPAAAQCPGDCNADGAVAINELVTAVAIALGEQPVDACAAADTSDDGAVTINELLSAVAAALDGCPEPDIVAELAATGLGRYLDLEPVSESTSGPWRIHHFDPADEAAICLRGGEYKVAVYAGTANRALIYFEGGGACWDNESCWESPTAKLTADPVFGGGIFELDNPENPFRHWTIVYAPYCDGSVFGGDNIVDYPGGRVYHHGVQNASAAVALLRRVAPDAEQIVVAGSSAGGYGTLTGYGLTRLAFPDTPIVTINDSGPGLQNLDDPDSVQERLDHWNYAQFVPPSCARCAEQLTYLTEWGLERDATLRVGYFSYLQDFVIRTFLNLPPAQYETLLRDVTDDLRTRQSERFTRFLVPGEGHTVLWLPTFYTLAVDGITVRDWVAGGIANDENWRDLVEDGDQ